MTGLPTTEAGSFRADRPQAMSGTEERAGEVRLLIVDDHDLFRTGLATLLGAQERIDVVAQASGGRSGVRLAHELKPDVVLMDLRMPDLGGVEATRAIVEREPATRVVALTVASEDGDVAAVMAAGACGFLVKDAPLEDITAAVWAAAQGAAWLSPRAAQAVLGRLRGASIEPDELNAPRQDLTPRELDVLRLVARGLENAQIAAKMDISPQTVKNHVSSILKKLGLPNRIQAAIYAVRHGLE